MFNQCLLPLIDHLGQCLYLRFPYRALGVQLLGVRVARAVAPMQPANRQTDRICKLDHSGEFSGRLTCPVTHLFVMSAVLAWLLAGCALTPGGMGAGGLTVLCPRCHFGMDRLVVGRSPATLQTRVFLVEPLFHSSKGRGSQTMPASFPAVLGKYVAHAICDCRNKSISLS